MAEKNYQRERRYHAVRGPGGRFVPAPPEDRPYSGHAASSSGTRVCEDCGLKFANGESLDGHYLTQAYWPRGVESKDFRGFTWDGVRMKKLRTRFCSLPSEMFDDATGQPLYEATNNGWKLKR